MILGRHGTFSQNKLSATFDYAKQYGINATQIFVKGPQSWVGREFTAQEIAAWRRARTDIYVCAHTGYFINISSGDLKSKQALLHEARRCSALGIKDLVVHPGSSLKKTMDEGIHNATLALHQLDKYWPKDVRLLLETMAGQGAVLSSLPTLLEVIGNCGDIDMDLGICYDTAHVHGYGVDLTTTDEIYDTRIKLFHINDSEVAFGSKKDRHASLGTGTIPLSAFKRIAQIKDVPFIMETPVGNELYDLGVFKALAN